jgi:hypothetical protein
MKKLLLACLATALLISCNNSSETGSTDTTTLNNNATTDSTEIAIEYPQLNKDTAELMIYHFLSSDSVDHSKAAEIQRIEFNGKSLKKLLTDKDTERFRLFTAAYRGDYSIPDMRHKKTIILQLKKGNQFIYYDIYAMDRMLGSSADRSPICPPPSGVCGLTFASTFDQVKAQLQQ